MVPTVGELARGNAAARLAVVDDISASVVLRVDDVVRPRAAVEAEDRAGVGPLWAEITISPLTPSAYAGLRITF